MDAYKVLMVDDEAEVIDMIVRKLDWEEMGFLVCGHARNGVEALEMAEEYQPDVVMTDIRMPYMDGLRLCRELRNLYPDIRLIIFSGFDDFEYAKEAIRLEAEEYLLKPIDAAEVRKVFERVRERLDKASRERKDIRRLEEHYRKSLPFLRENFYISLTEGEIPEDKIQEYMEDYQVSLPGPWYVVAVIHVGSALPDGMSARLLHLSVRQLAEEWAQETLRSQVFAFRGNLAVISQLDRPEDVSRYTDRCDRFCRLARRAVQALVTVGVGRPCRSLRDIPTSYEGAREAVSYRVLYGAGSAISIMELEPSSSSLPAEAGQRMNEVIKQIKMGNRESLSRAIEAYMGMIREADLSPGHFRLLVMELATAMYHLADSASASDLGEPVDKLVTGVMAVESDGQLEEWLVRSCTRLQDLFLEGRTSKTRSFVRQAEDYMEENYSDPGLTLESLCAYLGVSAAYFSTVFKKETGKTFVTYLTDLRMREARRMLEEGDEKTYIIAERCGYEDPNYFSYVFRKQFGLSPSKFRKSLHG